MNDLTEQERSILGGLLQGKTNRQIAQDLGLSRYTVRDHISMLLARTDTVNRTALALHWRMLQPAEPAPRA